MGKCCAAKAKPVYSYGWALAILSLGYLSNYLGGLIVGVRMNLLYWWVTAAIVLLTFQLSKERFFRYDQSLFGVFFVAVRTVFLCYVPLVYFPWLSGFFVWPMYLGAVVSIGFVHLLQHVYSQRLMVPGCDRPTFAWLMFSVSAAATSSGWFSLGLLASVASGFCMLHASVFSGRLVSRINLAGSLTLAMGTSWGYSMLLLALSSWSGYPIRDLYFCDCWKTMGVVMLGDKWRDQVASRLRKGRKYYQVRLDGALKHIIPIVIASGYLASVFWSIVLNGANWLMSMRIFSTVLVSACPCVISVAEPITIFMYQVLSSRLGYHLSDEDMDKGIQACLNRNLDIVRMYYLASVCLSCGGSYVLFGFWITPWTAGLLMLFGQSMLALNSFIHVIGSFARSEGSSMVSFFMRQACQVGYTTVTQLGHCVSSSLFSAQDMVADIQAYSRSFASLLPLDHGKKI